jgi:peptidoglycan/LPS O-acetylase OafA/YrhL
MVENKKIYLPGLNGIRAIAAIAVVASHINHRSVGFGLPSMPLLDLAGYGVTMFFVLSGFLITFLLLKEKKLTNTINYKFFFIRRALRIWPLYFLYLLILMLLFGVESFRGTLVYYVFFMPNFVNLAVAEYGVVPVSTALSEKIGHYWSLGVEEQFYIFWPLVIKFLNKYLFAFLLFFPIVFLLFKIALKVLNSPVEIQAFFHYSRFGCLAIGGIGAYLYFNHIERIKYFNSLFVQIICWSIMAFIASNNFYIYGIINHEIVAIVTVLLIFNQIHNPKPLISLENAFFDFLGKISFGLYIYNPLVIFFMQKALNNLSINTVLKMVLVYSSVFAALILISYLSFQYYENYFLRFKKNFIKVNSFSNNKTFKSVS